MIVGVTGLGNTGSMAMIDLLKEYDEVFYDEYLGEFSLCYFPDGLADLETHICDIPFRFQSSDIALDRFEKYVDWLFASHRGNSYKYNNKLHRISEQFLDDITQIKWRGCWSYRLQNRGGLWNFFQKVLFKTRRYLGGIGERLYIEYISTEMRYSVRPDDFQQKAKEYITQLISATTEGKNKITVIDMAFPGDNPESCFHYFDNPYAIVVDRDPRDLYVLSKKYIRADSLWVPVDDVNDFIFYYKNMREKANLIKDKQRVLRVQYEDIIYDLDNVKTIVEEFLDIHQHTRKKKYFNPEDSINNTQLFKLWPDLHDDIEIIEKELAPWLFDFERYGDVEHKKRAW